MNTQRSPSRPRRAVHRLAITSVALGAITYGCASNERAYEDVVAIDRRDASRFDSAAIGDAVTDAVTDAAIDGAIDGAPLPPIDRTTVDEYGRRAARVFSFMRSCNWPPRTLRAQSLFLQFAAGFDAVFQRYVDCAMRSETCPQYGSCVVGGNSTADGTCWGDVYFHSGFTDIFDCGAVSRGQAQCSDRGCNDVRRCPTRLFGARCDGEFLVDCYSPTVPVYSCPAMHPALRCVEAVSGAGCDIPEAPLTETEPLWSCDGTMLVQRSRLPFGWLHSAASLLARPRETRFDCARMGLRCDPNGACVDPDGECTFRPGSDVSGELGPDHMSYRHCFGGRWYSFPILPLS